ncbi:hypothetical protein [Bradyrhizobium sp.]|jgi:hypothetical protein|uniref:hypothetical protein n=1 Tax=Bradyrhizobium sp. TaxID=376 RepID=UPI003D0F9CE5
MQLIRSGGGQQFFSKYFDKPLAYMDFLNFFNDLFPADVAGELQQYEMALVRVAAEIWGKHRLHKQDKQGILT